MKKFFSHQSIRKQLEYLNIAIGVVLLCISAVYLFGGEIDYFASWFIFGCMYIVMDTYWCSDHYSPARVRADMFKYAVNIAGLVVSLGFLFYIV